MGEEHNPKTAAGPFYVVNGPRIPGGRPVFVAPGLMTLDDEGDRQVLRNWVRFSLHDEHEAADLATLLLGAFAATSQHGECTQRVSGDAYHAEFEYTHSAKYGTPHRYTVERLPAPSAPGTSPDRDAPSAFWLLAQHDGRFAPIWLHEVLVNQGAKEIRWFSCNEWKDGADGAALPY